MSDTLNDSIDRWAEIPVFVGRGLKRVATGLTDDDRRPRNLGDAVYLSLLVIGYALAATVCGITRAARRAIRER